MEHGEADSLGKKCSNDDSLWRERCEEMATAAVLGRKSPEQRLNSTGDGG